MSVDCDVAILGAGIAGSAAATLLARAGATVLLLDRARFPRDKVCGGCLHADALAALDRAGLQDAIAADAPVLRVAALHVAGRELRLRIPPGRVISRRRFDAALLGHAVAAGVSLRLGAGARIERIEQDGVVVAAGAERIRCKMALLARGLAPASPHEPLAQGAPEARSRVGLGAEIAALADLPDGTIRMACGAQGYVGMAQLGDGRALVAAAVDRRALDERPPAELIGHLLRKAGLAVPDDLAGVVWRGTPPLTWRAPPVAASRVFRIGDAAGYVEPFSGDGMTCALLTAEAVVPLVVQGIDSWSDALRREWQIRHRQAIGWRAARTRAIAGLVRHERLLHHLIPLMDRLPRLLDPLIRAAYGGATAMSRGRSELRG